MTKKDFSKKVAATVATQVTANEERFAKADAALLNSGRGTLATVPVTEAPSRKSVAPLKSMSTVVRDTFSMPSDEYAVLDVLRGKAAASGRFPSKSELVRCGIRALKTLTTEQLCELLEQGAKLKPGPKS
jgi:Arc/MetJ-type ribon-helix-helix transcriptional regulator